LLDPTTTEEHPSLEITLTQGALDNGYISLQSNQQLIPSQFVADEDGKSEEQFELVLPGGEIRTTCLLGKYSRIQARFNALFKRASLAPGDKAIISADPNSRNHFQLAFQRQQIANMAFTNSATGPSMKPQPLNQVLYGPPGTGKTFATIDLALEILDPAFLKENRGSRELLKRRFDEFVTLGDVRFVTFHQSFSYEDFIEGLRAQNGPDGHLVYEVTDGVFKSICNSASARVTQLSEESIDITGRRIWKMSLGNSLGEDAYIFDECIENDYALLGYGGDTDFSECRDRNAVYEKFLAVGKTVDPDAYAVTAVNTFIHKVKEKDILIVSEGNSKFRAIGEVAGNYRVLNRDDAPGEYGQCRSVKWLRVYQPSLPIDRLMRDQFSQMTLYELRPSAIDLEKLSALLDSPVTAIARQSGIETPSVSERGNPKVLIIDEINRGNVSRIFGELITLIETSKRAGQSESLEVTLPYSKQRFSVPSNLYLIGTMNTADRSLTSLDLALRRRFSFKEMPPRPDLLNDVEVDGIDVSALLRSLNERIEALLDRDHRIGHAYFLKLRKDPTIELLSDIFRFEILPLLQEYFFEDWKRIQMILNDHRKAPEFRFVTLNPGSMEVLFGEGELSSGRSERWSVNDDAFDRVESYLGVIDTNLRPRAVETENQAQVRDIVIKQLSTGTIEVSKNGQRQAVAKQVLLELARELDIDTNYATGTQLNTRHLGKRVIEALNERKA
jgi:5-methylcytosine-specific restriction protein B